jgi:hypothetical protein
VLTSKNKYPTLILVVKAMIRRPVIWTLGIRGVSGVTDHLIVSWQYYVYSKTITLNDSLQKPSREGFFYCCTQYQKW